MSDPRLPDPMPDPDQDQDQDDDDNDDEKDNLRALRQKARQADELAAKLAAYERNDLFRNAGIDPGDARARYFVKGYEGELNVDAIKAAASEAGFLQPQNQNPSPGHYTPDSMERIFNATSGGQAPAPQDWQGALAEADRIADPQAREDAILSVVERYGGVTARTAQ